VEAFEMRKQALLELKVWPFLTFGRPRTITDRAFHWAALVLRSKFMKLLPKLKSVLSAHFLIGDYWKVAIDSAQFKNRCCAIAQLASITPKNLNLIEINALCNWRQHITEPSDAFTVFVKDVAFNLRQKIGNPSTPGGFSFPERYHRQSLLKNLPLQFGAARLSFDTPLCDNRYQHA
jgi:hypothetical protein